MRDVDPVVAEKAANIHGDFYYLNVTHPAWWIIGLGIAALAFPFGVIVPVFFLFRAIHTEAGLRGRDRSEIPSEYTTRSDLMSD